MGNRGGAAHPLVELTLARFREFLREPEAVFWVFAFPVIMTCALGIAFRNYNRWETNMVQTAGTAGAQTAFMCIVLAAFDMLAASPNVSFSTTLSPLQSFAWHDRGAPGCHIRGCRVRAPTQPVAPRIDD